MHAWIVESHWDSDLTQRSLHLLDSIKEHIAVILIALIGVTSLQVINEVIHYYS